MKICDLEKSMISESTQLPIETMKCLKAIIIEDKSN